MCIFTYIKYFSGNSLVVQEPALSLSRAQIQSLLRELGSYEQHSVAKGKKKEKKNIFNVCIYIYIYTPALVVFPGGSEVKAFAPNVQDPGSIPGSGRSPGEGNGNPLQYSCLEKPMDGGAW